MGKVEPKVYTHCSYIGTTGYNNHTRSFLRALSKLVKVKARNFTVSDSWEGLNDTPHDRDWETTMSINFRFYFTH